jgi:DNA-binding CsgD family transcriptional regulator
VRKLVAHLQQGLQLQQRLFALTQQRDLLALGLEGLGVGAVLVDAHGHVRYANSIAEGFLRRGDGLALRQRRLQASTQAATSALERLIRTAARHGAGLDQKSGGVLALPCTTGGCLHALVCPVPASKAHGIAASAPCALVFISDAARNVALRPPDLMRLYGLTRAEATLMSALAGGKSLEDYVEAAGIGRATAKTHLQQIFMKLDWHRQSDVVRAALASGVAQIAASHL